MSVSMGWVVVDLQRLPEFMLVAYFPAINRKEATELASALSLVVYPAALDGQIHWVNEAALKASESK